VGLLGAEGVPPDLLTLEITEGHVMSDPERAVGVLRRLRGLGVHLAIDDSGPATRRWPTSSSSRSTR
jgi:EAL domain-containing protein (putative c-di-GMP-specific phosphodiesterase class I)